MSTIGITGGTGFVGSHLTSLFINSGCNVVIFTRSPEKYTSGNNVTYAYWDPAANKCDLGALRELHAVVNLAGTSIAGKRWTEKRKKQIRDSRVQGTRFLVAMLQQHAPNCKTLVSASAIGYYGADKADRPFTESDIPANDFLGQTCLQWEQEALVAKDFLKVVALRFGIVLGADGGAYPQLAMPGRCGIKPIFGSGKQMVSWIHVDDLVRLIQQAINNDSMSGVYNAVTPYPIAHKQLMNTIAGYRNVSLPIAIPAFALKLALGEMSIELLKSCTVSAQKLVDAGFSFHYPDITSAIAAIAGKHSR